MLLLVISQNNKKRSTIFGCPALAVVVKLLSYPQNNTHIGTAALSASNEVKKFRDLWRKIATLTTDDTNAISL